MVCKGEFTIPIKRAGFLGGDLFFLLPVLAYALLSTNDTSILPGVGILLIAVSMYNCVKVGRDRLLFLLFLIIGFINISLGVTDFIGGAVSVSEWQLKGLRPTEYNVEAAKSLLITNVIFSFFLKGGEGTGLYKEKKNIRENNLIISCVGIVVLFLILAYGMWVYGFETGTYVSVSSPIFEYSLFIVVAVWYYSGDYKWMDVLLVLYAFAYCLFFLLRGDRSSVFMLAVLIFAMYFYEHFKTWQMILLLFVTVLLGNFIGIVRSLEDFGLQEILNAVLSRGLYVDTFSFSYYAAIAMSALFRYDVSHFTVGKNFLLYQIGLGDSKYANIASFAKDSFKELYNQGGGLFSAPFYSFAGYLGVILASAFAGFFLRKIFAGRGSRMLMYQMLIVAMSFRWYLYSPTTFIRGNLILFTIFLVLMEVGMALLKIVGILYEQKRKT